jgi:outer membrane protein assembly factor BamB
VPARLSPFGLAGTRVASVIGRRRVLSGLGGLVVAGGLAAAGWELARPGRVPAGAGTTAGRGTGQQVAWVRRTDGPMRSGSAISGGTVYIGSDAGTVYALDAASGRLADTYRVGSAVSGVTVASETLFASSADGKVQAINIGNLGYGWVSQPAGAAIAGAPVWGGNIVYAGSDDHYVYALDPRTGQRKWRAKSGGTTLPSTPTGTGVVWVGSQDGTLYVLSTSTGKVVGKLAAGGPVGAAPVTVTGQVYAGTSKGLLWNLYYDDFTKRIEANWNFQAHGPIMSAPVPAASGDITFVATGFGIVHAVQSGHAVWNCQVNGPVRSGLAVYDGMVYAGDDDGYLSAIDISTGTVSWKYPAGGAIRSIVLAKDDGLVCIGTLDQRVHALHAHH